MPRYVFFARSHNNDEDVERIRTTPGVTVVDEESGRSLLVDTTEDTANALRSSLDDWLVEEEVTYPRPGPHRYSVLKRK